MKSKVIFTGLFSLLLLAGCQPNQTTTPSSTTNQSSETTVTSTNKTEESSTTAASTDSSSSQTANPDIKVSADRAIELFQNKYPDAAITSLELDSDWGSYFYKIEGVDDQNE